MNEQGEPDARAVAQKVASSRSLLPVFVIVVVVTALSILLLYLALAAQSAVRGYVAGESAWSKSQIDAVLMLQMYGETRDDSYLRRYKSAIAVPLIDRQVRMEMQKRDFSYEFSKQGMLAGGIDAQEIPGMIALFRCCANVSIMKPVIEFWERADPHLLELDMLAQDLQNGIASGTATDESIDLLLVRVADINESIRPLAKGFNAALGAAAREITFLIFFSSSAVLIGLVSIGALIASRVLLSLRRSEVQLRSLLNSADDGIVVIGRDNGSILDINPRAASMVGLLPTAARGMNYDSLLRGEKSTHVRSEFSLPQQIAIKGTSRKSKAVAEVNYSVAEWNGQPAHLAIVRDVTERLASERDLHIANNALANLAEGVMILDRDFRIVSVNRAYKSITGYLEVDVIGKAPPLPRSRRSDIRRYREIRRTLRETGAWHGELLNQRKGGEYYSELHRISCVRDDQGVITHFVCVFNDNTDVRESERKLRFLAQHDPLTKLLNRSKFEEKAKEAIENAAKTNAKAAVLFIDLDNFKTVNDTFGHAAGDLYLSTVGNRISGSLRGTDLVGRVGGDEFSVLLPNINSRTDAAMVAAKLRDAIARQFEFDGHEISGSASVGLCLYPDDAQSVEQLLVHADAAMYEAKKRGRNNLQWFLPEMTSRVESKLALASGLRVAAQRGQLELHYQPCVDLRTGAIRGLEALLRWTHPELGRVSPGVFIPVAEEFGVIDGLTDFVLREACRQGKAWQDAGLQPIPIAINLSPRNFWDADLSSKVRTVLEQSGWPAKYLRLEITESTIMGGENPEAVMHQLRSLGVSLSIDDFGIGHSSLSSLQKFPVQCMKIDLSFTREIPENKTNFAITKTIISLAKNLGLELVAEGIETEIQAETLMKEGCAQGQGYYFCKPVPAVQIEDLLRDNLTARRFARQKVN
jgi:diguanylate cyclase (GGDEF)-like protein/PAS domain S-box-containing protein